jgi:hypothetical protein
MTTIAWDGKMLAADRCSCSAGCFRFPITKLKRLKDGRLYASAGDTSDGVLVRQWLDGEIPDKPKIDEDSFVALIVSSDGAFRMEGKLVSWPVEAPHAIGSGREYAIAAMYLGKSAVEAVEIAALFDPNTGMGVNSAAPLAAL